MKNNRRKFISGLLALAILSGCQNGSSDIAGSSPEPTKPAVDQATFEELPAGIIYEFSEVEKEEFLKAAKEKYEANKEGQPMHHSGPFDCQDVEFEDGVFNLCVWPGNTGEYYTDRPDVVRRNNTQPSDMLNDDFSLRYPDMFYGFVAYDHTNLEGNANDIKNIDINPKINQALLYEDYFLNVAKPKTAEEWNSFILSEIADKEDEVSFDEYTLKKRYMKSNVNSAQSVGFNKIFDSSFAGSLNQDMYQMLANYAKEEMYYTIVSGLETAPSKYTAEPSKEDGVVFYYPTKIWKINNNTIVVDVEINNADGLTVEDIMEVKNKILKSNTTFELSLKNVLDKKYTYDENKYVVYTRLFNSDLTQGFVPDLGMSIANYPSFGSGILSNKNYVLTSEFVFNDVAKEVIRSYYSEAQKRYNEGTAISTEEILKQISKEKNISYQDALNIWGSFYVTHMVQYAYWD